MKLSATADVAIYNLMVNETKSILSSSLNVWKKLHREVPFLAVFTLWVHWAMFQSSFCLRTWCSTTGFPVVQMLYLDLWIWVGAIGALTDVGAVWFLFPSFNWNVNMLASQNSRILNFLLVCIKAEVKTFWMKICTCTHVCALVMLNCLLNIILR